MPKLVNQQISRACIYFCVACVLAGLLVGGCGSREISTKLSNDSTDEPTSASPTLTRDSTAEVVSQPLLSDELITARDQWGNLFKSLDRCLDVVDTNCHQNAGTGILNGSPIAATLYCDYKEYSAGQWACDWMINFYKYSDATWLSSGSIQSQLYEMFDGAFFAEMTGDDNSELYFSVMNISFTEAEVFSFEDGQWGQSIFDGQKLLYMGNFNSKTGKMESGVSLDMGKPCDFRRWTKLVYAWNGSEFNAVSGLDENENPISLKKALECK